MASQVLDILLCSRRVGSERGQEWTPWLTKRRHRSLDGLLTSRQVRLGHAPPVLHRDDVAAYSLLRVLLVQSERGLGLPCIAVKCVVGSWCCWWGIVNVPVYARVRKPREHGPRGVQ